MNACAVSVFESWRTWFRASSQLVHAPQIGSGVVAHRRHDERIAAEQLQVVGDIAGAAAEFAPQLRYEEGHVQDVDLVRQDVVLEMAMEDHDVVVGDRAADQGAHVNLDVNLVTGRTGTAGSQLP